jgi:aspartate racemase
MTRGSIGRTVLRDASSIVGGFVMKTIGLLGGMTSESTVPYYQIINRRVNERLGREHSAKLLLYSVDFEELAVAMNSGNWEEAGLILGKAAARLEGAGADFLVICSNTMHKVVPAVEDCIRIPILHIADAAAAEIKRKGFRKVGLLGTRFTMEHAFYRSRLETEHGIEVIVPPERDRATIHEVIEEELGFGKLLEASRAEYLRIIDDLGREGAEGVILGCTEIPLLVQGRHSKVPLFDTTALHAQAAARFALGD